ATLVPNRGMPSISCKCTKLNQWWLGSPHGRSRGRRGIRRSLLGGLGGRREPTARDIVPHPVRRIPRTGMAFHPDSRYLRKQIGRLVRSSVDPCCPRPKLRGNPTREPFASLAARGPSSSFEPYRAPFRVYTRNGKVSMRPLAGGG